MLFPCNLLAAGRTGVARSWHNGFEIARAMTSLLCGTCSPSSFSYGHYYHGSTSTIPHMGAVHHGPPPSLALWHHAAGLQHLPHPRRSVICGTSGGSAFNGGWYADENRVYQPLRGLHFWTKQQKPDAAPPEEDGGGSSELSSSSSSSSQGQGAAEDADGAEQKQQQGAQATMYPQPAHVQRELYTVNVGRLLQGGVVFQRCCTERYTHTAY